MIDEVENNTRGAFSPLTQHPLVGALMIPLGGAGTLSLIDLFARG